jgi:hypothetical protein
MAPRTCPFCKKTRVDHKATVCPYCRGKIEPISFWKTGRGIIFIILGIFFGIPYITGKYYLQEDSIEKAPIQKSQSANKDWVQNTKTTASGYLASTSEELLDKAISYLVDKDNVALQKILDTGLVFELKGGLSVYVVNTKMFSGKVKIRPVGETVEIWTLIEAIK